MADRTTEIAKFSATHTVLFAAFFVGGTSFFYENEPVATGLKEAWRVSLLIGGVVLSAISLVLAARAISGRPALFVQEDRLVLFARWRIEIRRIFRVVVVKKTFHRELIVMSGEGDHHLPEFMFRTPFDEMRSRLAHAGVRIDGFDAAQAPEAADDKPSN
jgi:hypothetical protein